KALARSLFLAPFCAHAFRPARLVAGRIRFGVAVADDFQEPPRGRAEKTAAARYGDDLLACREIADPDGRDRAEAQLIGGVASRQQRETETGFDQPLLRGEAVHRRPGDL